jgi:PAS domain S-box-containing protein
MTGYTLEDAVGKTPRILQGPKSDREELGRLGKAIEDKVPCEITTINYKKSGEEFWANFSVTPVINANGQCTHFITIERDVTAQKNDEFQKRLFSEISQSFSANAPLTETLNKVLACLIGFGSFCIAEVWLIDPAKMKIGLAAKASLEPQAGAFFDASADIKSFIKGGGLPGIVWSTQLSQFWAGLGSNVDFKRRAAAGKIGLESAYGVPLFHNSQIIGALVLGSTVSSQRDPALAEILEGISPYLGAEVKRKQIEEELNQIFNFTPDVLCIANIDGFFKKVNPAMCLLLEYSEDELLTKPFLTLVHPEDKKKTATELQNIINGNPTYYIENRYITKQGKVKWLAWTTTGASNEGILYCSAKDITDKKELEVLLNKATSLARIGGWEVDVLNGSVYWSAVTKEIHEVPADFDPDMEKGYNFYKEGESREKVRGVVKEAMENGTDWDVEAEIETAKGNTKWVRVIGETEFVKGRCVRITGSFQDIDARKKAQRAAIKALEERNIILESIDDAFFAVDKNWIVTYWNRRAELVLGKTKETMLHHNLWELFAHAEQTRSYELYHQAMQTGVATYFEEYHQPSNKWYEASVYPSVDGLSVYFKDITERVTTDANIKALNESLLNKAKELEVSNLELEQFAFVASHDLQEPLRMVTSFLSQLEKKYGDTIDEKGKRYIFFAVDGAKRMRQLILGLLEFSRVGKAGGHAEPVDLTGLVNNILPLFRKQVEETKATITCHNLPTLHISKAPIAQVFQNLIGNALKYHTKGLPPNIVVTCDDVGHGWLFSVKDNGIGIEAEYFDRIFIIFQRLHNKSEYEGTGMGLAVTKKIIDNLGGRMWVESEVGKGSTFYFTLRKDKL